MTLSSDVRCLWVYDNPYIPSGEMAAKLESMTDLVIAHIIL